MQKIFIFIYFSFSALLLQAQQLDYNEYYPKDVNSGDWKYMAHSFYNNHNNSNYLSNEFSFALNNSDYIDQELKDKQMDLIKGDVLLGRKFQGGFGLWVNRTKKQNSSYFYFGMDFQQILDGNVDPDFVGLALYGNKHYAGESIEITNTEYSNVYFNRLKFGMGKSFGSGDIKQHVFGLIGFTIGQNSDYFKLQYAGLYTHPDGDYLDIDIQAKTQLADTVWANVFEINGLGASLDLHYSLIKEKDFYLAVNLNNLGFVHWNKNPFTANVDTAFRFEGVDQQEISGDFSGDRLRNMIFTNPETSAFNKALPFDIRLAAGKFFRNGEFYLGVNTTIYPGLLAKYRSEIFVTWNIRNRLQLSPILGYSSYQKLNIGLAVGVQVFQNLYFKIGSSYMNSMFVADAAAAQGGFISLVFVN